MFASVFMVSRWKLFKWKLKTVFQGEKITCLCKTKDREKTVDEGLRYTLWTI